MVDLSDTQVLDVNYETGTLTGTITINGAPMTGAVVEVRSDLGTLSAPVDASGVYAIEAPVDVLEDDGDVCRCDDLRDLAAHHAGADDRGLEHEHGTDPSGS